MVDMKSEENQKKVADFLAEFEGKPNTQQRLGLYLTTILKEVDTVEEGINMAREALTKDG